MALKENNIQDNDKNDDSNNKIKSNCRRDKLTNKEFKAKNDQICELELVDEDCDKKVKLIKSKTRNSSSESGNASEINCIDSSREANLNRLLIEGAKIDRACRISRLSRTKKSASSVEFEDSSSTSSVSSTKSDQQQQQQRQTKRVVGCKKHSVREEECEKLQKVASSTRWFDLILNGIRSNTYSNTNLNVIQKQKLQKNVEKQDDISKYKKTHDGQQHATDFKQNEAKCEKFPRTDLKIPSNKFILKNLSSSHSDKHNLAQGSQLANRELPSFGETRTKLQRLPYYIYRGRAKNVRLINAAERPQIKADNQLTLSSSSSSSLSSLGSSRLSSFSISNLPVKVTQKNSSYLTKKQRELRQRGYSNISNLFPDKPMPIRRTIQLEKEQQQQQNQQKYINRHSKSLLNLNELTDPPRQLYNNLSRRHNQYNRYQADSNWRTMRRHNSMLGGQGANNGSATATTTANGVNIANAKLQANSNRPASVSGNYGAQGARSHRRSPSAGSLHYGISTANNRNSSAANYGPIDFQDPDCPVHGIYDQNQEKSLVTDSAGPISPNGLEQPESPYGYPVYGSRRRGPAYYESPNARDRGYLGGRVGPNYASAYSLYSPTSPLDNLPATGNNGIRSAALPYYDRESRFSVYQGGQGNIYKSPTMGSTSQLRHSAANSILAPPKEQVRRILGYPAPVKPVHLHPQWAYSRPFHHLLPSGVEWTQPNLTSPDSNDINNDQSYYIDYDDDINQLNASLLRFSPFNKLEDTQAIRAVDFHPSGQVYAIGSNSRALRICAYPAPSELNSFGSSLLMGVANNTSPASAITNQDSPTQIELGGGSGSIGLQHQAAQSPRVLFKFLQVHRGSIYCVKFNKTGQLLATGSNDQTVHIVRYNSRTHSPEGDEYRLTMHDGTVRDLCFIDDATSGNSLLISAGGGDNKIYVTDCDTITPFQSFAGHTSMIMGLHHIGGASFVSCSQDRTIRFWDLRTRHCTSIVSAPPSRQVTMGGGTGGVTGSRYMGGGGGGISGGPGAPVCAVQADHSGRLLVSGHTDSTCMLYDIRGSRIIQAFKPHEDEIRTVSFSPKSYYLLTGAYDGRIVLSDLQGDLNQPLPSVCVAESDDKIIQSRWHPTDFTFVTTSANKTATLWVPPTDAQ